jgi:hypothetical protein
LPPSSKSDSNASLHRHLTPDFFIEIHPWRNAGGADLQVSLLPCQASCRSNTGVRFISRRRSICGGTDAITPKTMIAPSCPGDVRCKIHNSPFFAGLSTVFLAVCCPFSLSHVV